MKHVETILLEQVDESGSLWWFLKVTSQGQVSVAKRDSGYRSTLARHKLYAITSFRPGARCCKSKPHETMNIDHKYIHIYIYICIHYLHPFIAKSRQNLLLFKLYWCTNMLVIWSCGAHIQLIHRSTESESDSNLENGLPHSFHHHP